MVSEDIVIALSEFRTVKIAMPESDTLADGRDLVTRIQAACDFPLAYVQRLGCEPAMLVWRFRDKVHAMEGFKVERHAC